MPTNKTEQQTITHIRTLFSSNCYMSLKFYNKLLSITFFNSQGRDQMNKPIWGNRNEIRLSYDEAIQLIEAIMFMTADPKKPVAINTTITRENCILSLQSEKNGDKYIASLILNTTNNGENHFIFEYSNVTYIDEATDSKNVLQIQTQLLAFKEVLASYVAGINSDRHLDKMTEDYAKLQESKAKDNNKNQGYNQNNQNQNKNRWNNNSNSGNNNSGNNRWKNNWGNNNNYGN